jgi:MAF protein
VAEESYLLDEPLASALNVAAAKARHIAAPSESEVVLAADTLVVADGRVLGKPSDDQEAMAMLRALRGRAHAVLSGVALVRADGATWGGVVSTAVVMRAYTDAEIEAYVARGEPFDKAGGYAVQDGLFRPVERVDGCYLNVVGLPLCAAARGLETLGLFVRTRARTEWIPPCGYCRAGAPLVALSP